MLRCYRANSEKLHLARLFGIAGKLISPGNNPERFEWIILYGGTLFYRRYRSPCMRRATLSDLLLLLCVLLQLTCRNRLKKIATQRHWLGSKVRSAAMVTIVGSSGASQRHETLPTETCILVYKIIPRSLSLSPYSK